jgi:meiotic recombination protein SPO11
MDFDLLSDILTDHPPDLNGGLLQNLPDRSLTHDVHSNTAAERETPAAFLEAQSPNQAGAIISKIEDIFESIADSILNQKQEMVMRLKIRRKPGVQSIAAQNASVKSLYDVKFPSKSPREAWKFSESPTT